MRHKYEPAIKEMIDRAVGALWESFGDHTDLVVLSHEKFFDKLDAFMKMPERDILADTYASLTPKEKEAYAKSVLIELAQFLLVGTKIRSSKLNFRYGGATYQRVPKITAKGVFCTIRGQVCKVVGYSTVQKYFIAIKHDPNYAEYHCSACGGMCPSGVLPNGKCLDCAPMNECQKCGSVVKETLTGDGGELRLCPDCYNAQPKRCFLCNKQADYDDFVPGGTLCTGRRWYEPDEKMIVFTGYLCDAHIDESDIEISKFL